MGEAKRRGTFEERKAIAIKRDAEIIKKRKLAGIGRINAMSIEEKEKQKRAMQVLTMMTAITNTSAIMPYKI